MTKKQSSDNKKAAQVKSESTENISKKPVFTPNEFKAKYADILKKAGLTGKEAVIFDILLEKGELGAGEIISETNLKRGDAYNQIYSLQQKGLISERPIRGRMKFSLEHPSLIEDYLEKRAKRLSEATKELRAALPGIISTYNLSYHRPGVKVFEGEEGAVKMMWDTLDSNTEILQIIDPSSLVKYLEKQNARYVTERAKKGIKKRVIFPDTSFAREYMKRYIGPAGDLTEFRVVKMKREKFDTSIQIYDNKYALHTLKPGVSVGIIIEDSTICEVQRAIFEIVWNVADKIND